MLPPTPNILNLPKRTKKEKRKRGGKEKRGRKEKRRRKGKEKRGERRKTNGNAPVSSTDTETKPTITIPKEENIIPGLGDLHLLDYIVQN
jgi:hypothetical protein